MARSANCPECGIDTTHQKFGSRLCVRCYGRQRRQRLANGQPSAAAAPPSEPSAVVSPSEPVVYRIYVLVDPRDDVIHYCGITQQPLATRLSMHLSSVTAGKTTPVYTWIAELRDLDLRPIIRLVEECDHPSREMYWIAYFKERGYVLHNMDEGMGHGRPTSDETRQRQAEAHTGVPLGEAQRAAQSRGHRPPSPEDTYRTAHPTGGEKIYRGFNREQPLSDQQLESFRNLARRVERDDQHRWDIAEFQHELGE